MEKTLAVVTTLILLATQAYAVSFELRTSCQEGETHLFSISNTTNANAAEPDHFQGFTGNYGQQGLVACAEGTLGASIVSQCDQISNPVLSFYNASSGTSHLSPVGERNDQVLCSPDLATSVFRSCPGSSDAIVSIYDPVENHVAEPGHYKWQICGNVFRNATLAYRFTMSGNKSFILNDEEQTGTETSTDEPGYGITQNESLMSGIVGNDNLPQITSLENQSGRTLVNSTINGNTNLEWFLPLTPGDSNDIEGRLDLIANNNFLTQFNPNFAFQLAEDALVRITLFLRNLDIVNNLNLGSGFYNLVVENLGPNSQGTPQVRINATTQ